MPKERKPKRYNKQIDLAIAADNLYLSIEKPDSQQVADQVKRLSRQMVGTLGVVSGEREAYLEPGYEEERPKEGKSE